MALLRAGADDAASAGDSKGADSKSAGPWLATVAAEQLATSLGPQLEQHAATARVLALAQASGRARTQWTTASPSKLSPCGECISCLPLLQAARKEPRVLPPPLRTQVDVRTVTVWLEQGGHVDAVDDDGSTMLMRAAIAGRTAETQLLLQKKAALELADCKGRTALLSASARGRAAEAELLMRARASPNAKDSDGNSALLLAAAAGREKIVAALLQAS